MGLTEPIVYVSRRMVFSAAHRLYHEDQCEDFYGKCSALHGHNYVVEVTVAGPVDLKSGYVIDLKVLKDLMHTHIMVNLDHKNLDSDVVYFQNRKIAQTAENIAVFIFNSLQEPILNETQQRASLYRVRLYETENNVVEFFG